MDINTIKEIIARLITYMGVNADEIATRTISETSTVAIDIYTKEAGRLIGTDGEHLDAFDHVVRKIAIKQAGTREIPKFTLDINKYKEGIVDTLRLKARLYADRATTFKTDVEFEPMTSYERMIVHSELKTFPHIKTESIGEGRERRVVAKYIE
ncbi:MAG: R3H domain-containing nucleic acid-binding protein [Patescibacteria group bacterium]